MRAFDVRRGELRIQKGILAEAFEVSSALRNPVKRDAGPEDHVLANRSHFAPDPGRTLSQHQALGEYYALVSGAQAAMEQFQIARCAGGGDFYQQSILDSRIRDMWERVLAERADSSEGDKSSASAGGAARQRMPVQQLPGRCP